MIDTTTALPTEPKPPSNESPESHPSELPEPQSLFPPVPTPLPVCTENTCLNGHGWVPRMVVVECPGCKAPILVMEMRLCPICNEPATHTRLRTEHVTRAMGVQAPCRGEESRGENITINFERKFWRGVEEKGHSAPISEPTTNRESKQ